MLIMKHLFFRKQFAPCFARTTQQLLMLLVALFFVGAVSANVSYVGQNTSVSSSGGTTSLTVSPVSSTQESDVLLAHITVRSNNTPTPPSGWTMVYNQVSDNVRHILWYRTVPAGGLGAQTFTFSTSGRAVLGITTVRGADSINPIATFNTSSGTGTTATAPSVNASTAGSYVLAYFAGDDGGQAFNLLTTGRTPAWSFSTGGGQGSGVAGAMWHFAKPTAGATGTTQAGYSNDAWSATTVVIAPGAPFTCFTDNFNRTSGVGNDWAAAFPGAGNYIEMEFMMYAYGGSGADGIAIILSDATINPQPGGYGGSLGYAQRCGVNGFSGGWLGIGLDEFGNFSNPTECRVAGPGFRVDSVAVRGSGSGTTGYRYIAGTSTLSPGVDQNTSGHLYRIRIDARTNVIPVTIDRDTTATGNNYVNLISIANIASATGQAPLPANLTLSMTGSTGGSNNIHEIDDIGVCALKMDPITAQIDHFDFTPVNTPLTCTPTRIRVRACMNPACTSTYNGNVTVTLGPTGWQGSQPVTLVNGIGEFFFSRTTTGAQTNFSASNSSVPVKPFSQVTCNDTSPCSITWNDSGFVYTLPVLTSNKASNSITVQALQKSATNPASCAPAITGSRSIGFYSSYINPSSGASAVAVRDTGTASFTNIGQSQATRTPITLNFNSNAEAQIHVRYPDAGQINLQTYYAGSAATGDAGLVMTGASTNVAVPAGFCVEALTLTGPPTPLPACNNAACPAYQKAGEQFPLRLSARAWEVDGESNTQFCDNLITPNFQHTNFSLNQARSADPDLSSDGVLGVALASIVSGGSVTIANQTLSEAGRFVISSSNVVNYFGVPLTSSSSAPIGRFYPNHYNLAINQFDAACSGNFSYAGINSGASKPGQNIPFIVNIQAMNKGNGVLANYHGAYARLNGNVPILEDLTGGVAATDGDFSTGTLLNFTMGSHLYTPLDLQYRFNTTRAPYNVAIRARVTDSDGATGVSANSAERAFRLGRLRLENAYGPEQIPLPIPLRAEYFDGTRYRQNAEDNCTAYLGSNATLTSGSMNAALSGIAGPSATQTMQTGSSTVANPLLLTAPGTGNVGSVNVLYTPPVWLQFDWNNDGSSDATATGVATFGRYRGSDRVIYWREQRPPIIP